MPVQFNIFLFAAFASLGANAQRVTIIPEPVSVTEKSGSFSINRETKMLLQTPDSNTLRTLNLFADKFNTVTGIRFVKTSNSADTVNSIIIALQPDTSARKRESYTLNISRGNIRINAASAAGVFYAFTSLEQMLPPAFSSKTSQHGQQWSIPCANITDYPRFPYRGMHLDVSRHFFPPSFIRHYIDVLASFKINVFHWHLTDSHGWRLEIKQYPKLTSVGAWRADRGDIPMTIAQPTQPGEPATYGGFYTQEEVKEIIRYAQEKNISIIPEIEMPGHCTAALVAYPEYSDLDNKTPLLMPCGYPGDLQHNFCAGYDGTYTFLENILKEVMDLFPSDYIHIGGDEVRAEPWLNCRRCRQLMREKNFTTAKQLQAYFTGRIDHFITSNGKKTMGWDEILSANIAPSSVNMSWHGDSKAIQAAARGNATVMTPYWYTYFDFYQSDPELEPAISYARLQLDTVYRMNALPKTFTAAQAKYILGGQGCLWTENIPTPERVEYMLLPRLLALSEALWTPDAKKDYAKFINKTEMQFKRFDAAGINYARSLYNVNIRPVFDSADKTVRVTLSDQTYQYPIRYTVDGTRPSLQSTFYTKPFSVGTTIVLKTALFDKARQLGKTNIDSFIIHKAIGMPAVVQPVHAAAANLKDGILGTVEPYDGRWVMMTDSLVSITLDLKAQQQLQAISARFMEDQVGNIYLPKSLAISISADGTRYKKAFTIRNAKMPEQLLRHVVTYTRPLQARARFVKIEIRNAGLHATAGKNIMMLDELVIE